MAEKAIEAKRNSQLASGETVTETNEIMIIGGGEIYKQALGFSNRMYLTRVSASFAGADTFFPAWNEAFWHVDFEEQHPVDEKHKYAFDFQVLNRKNLS